MSGRLAQCSPNSTNWNCRSVNERRPAGVRRMLRPRRAIRRKKTRTLRAVIRGSTTAQRQSDDPDEVLAASGLLTAEQEIMLARMIAAGGEVGSRARLRFIEANQGLVRKVARKFEGCGVEWE